MEQQREKLEQSCGICPSQEWLEACRAHLQATNEDTVDAIMHQVLHSDLCDVVRNIPHDSQRQEASSAAMALRRAVMETMQQRQQHVRAVTLPESFKLLVQVDELLDVSLNAEARISVGPAPRTNPTPIGNQRNRCLKMMVRDGYANNNSSFFTAMEIRPIPNLSVHSKAGIKVLLRGPMQIRHGVLLWHPDNTQVLGGCVPALVQVQQKALQQAKRVAGVGVDPTVRALIWNPHTGDEQDEEEGEHESRDVTAATITPPPPQSLPPPSRATPSVPIAPASVVGQQQQPQSRPEVQPSNARRVAKDVASSRVEQTRTATSTRLASNSRSNNNNNPYRNPYATRNKTAPSTSSRPTLSVSTDAADVAPIHLSSGSANSPVDLITPTGPTAPPSRDASFSSSVPSSRTNQEVVRVQQTTPQQSPMPNQPRKPNCSQDTALTTDSDKSHSSHFAADEVYMSFPDLRALLKTIVGNRDVYKQYQDKVFVVPVKMKGFHKIFDIKKKRKVQRKEKKGDKYEYVMVCNMGSSNDGDGTITCKIANIILEPFFGVPPGAMRKLNREDKAKSKSIVRDGGEKVRAELAIERSWQIKLLETCDEFFAKETTAKVDGDEPVMEVVCRHDLQRAAE